MKLQEPVIPLSNVEKQLATLVGEYSGELDVPKSTVEAYLANLLGTYNGELPSPISKIEKYLGSMVGVYESDVFPRPIYSTELYFASYAGLWDGELPEVSNRVEYFLKKVIENTGKLIDRSGSGRVITFVDTGISRPFVNLDIYGRSTQETTTGKNLFDPDLFVDSVINKYPNNHVTIFDGRKAFYFDVNVNLPNINLYGNFKSGVSYCMSFMAYPLSYSDTMSEAHRSQGFNLVYSDGTDVKLGVKPINNPLNQWSKVLSDATDPNKQLTSLIATYGYSGKCYIDLDSIQLEESATATSYEPYTGGMPAPNPDYPMPIKSVGSEDGDVKVRVGGKNLIPYPYISSQGVIDGLSYIINDDRSITVSGKNTVGTNFWLAEPVHLTPGKYTLSNMGSFTTVGMSLRIYNPMSKKILGNLVSGRESLTFSVDEEQDVRIYLNVTTPNIDIEGTCYPMLEYGTTATPYEPYKTPQLLTVKTPEGGFLGSPIPRGYGYTYIDADGIAYKADVASLKSGMYKSQNVLHIWDGTENISHRAADPDYPQICRYTWYGYSSFGYHGMPVMCDIFRFSNDPNIRESGVVTLSEREDRTWLHFWVDKEIDTPEKFHALMMGHQILYVRNESVNLPIPDSADVVSEFKDLVSYRDSTVITNDKDAFMAATIKVREKSMYKMRRKAVRYE